MGLHPCNDSESYFRVIWQPCKGVHMTAGEYPVTIEKKKVY